MKLFNKLQHQKNFVEPLTTFRSTNSIEAYRENSMQLFNKLQHLKGFRRTLDHFPFDKLDRRRRDFVEPSTTFRSTNSIDVVEKLEYRE